MSRYWFRRRPYQQEEAPPPIGLVLPPPAVQQPRNYDSRAATAPPLVIVTTQPKPDPNAEYFDRNIPVDKSYNADCSLILFICLIPIGGFIILLLVAILLRLML